MFNSTQDQVLPPTPPSSTESSPSRNEEGDREGSRAESGSGSGHRRSSPPAGSLTHTGPYPSPPPSTSPTRSQTHTRTSLTPPRGAEEDDPTQVSPRSNSVTTTRTAGTAQTGSVLASTAIPEVLSESAHKAVAAVEAFQTAVREKLLAGALEDSAQHVATAVRSLVAGQDGEVSRLQEENAGLRRQLRQATGLVDELSDRLAAVRARELAWATSSSTEGAGEGGSGSTPAGGVHASALGPADEHDHVLPTATPSAVAALLADYRKVHALASMLEAERRRWLDSFRELSEVVGQVTKQNAELRQEVVRLETSTVALARYQDATQARDKAVYELAQLRVEAAKLAEQLDMDAVVRAALPADEDDAVEEEEEALAEARTCPVGEGLAHSSASADPQAPSPSIISASPPQSQDPHSPMSARQEVGEGGAPTQPTAGLAHGPSTHPGMWALALREVEEQAALAASHAATRERLQRVEGELAAATAAHASASAALRALTEEDEKLREDAQSLVFRNGVLSQQVASLLVKVENLRRAVRLARRDSGGEAAAEAANISPPAVVAPGARTRPQPWSPTASLPLGGGDREAIHAASAASALLLTRSGQGGACASPRPTASTAAGAASGGPPSSRETLLSSGLLEPRFAPAVEVVQGVQRGLAAFASRRRRVTLRRFGCAEVDVHLTCEPRLPACDQLSGVPLGRPTAYATLDPVRGTVERHGSSVELSLVRSSAGAPSVRAARPTLPQLTSQQQQQQRQGLGSRSAEEPGTTVISEVGAHENESFLHMLDAIDADDRLERYSVNSVTELVVRNQELLQQLYEATQRAERAESVRGPHLSSQSAHRGAASGKSLASVERSQDRAAGGGHGGADADEDRARAETPEWAAAGASRKRARTDAIAAGRGAATLPGSMERGESTSSAALTTRISNTNAVGPEHVIASQSDIALTPAPPPVDGARPPWMSAVLGAQALTSSAETAVAALVEAALTQHEAAAARRDEGLAAALVRLLETTAMSRTSTPGLRSAGGVAEADGEVLASLVALCTTQAAALAQQAVDAAAGEQTARAGVHQEGWARAQALLRQATDELKATLVQQQQQQQQQREGREAEGAQSHALSPTAANTGVADDAKDLSILTGLLQTAADKEDTVLRVHTTAQARQRVFLENHERRMKKLARRTERAVTALRELMAHYHLQQKHRGTGRSASPMLAPHEGPEFISSSSPQQQQQTESPVPGIGLASSPTPTPVVPALAVEQLAIPGVRTEGGGLVISEDPYMVIADDSDADADDDAELFSELRDRLALAQAEHARLSQELSEERATHGELYERMWQLETERDDARRERQKLTAAMHDMMTRDAYESVIADLDEAKGDVRDRDAQLAHAQEENNKLLTQIDLLNEQLASHQQRHEHANAAVREELARLGRTLDEENRRYARLHARNKQLEEEAVEVQRQADFHAMAAQEGAAQLHHLSEQLAELKNRFLAAESTQALLAELYPGNTVLAATAALAQQARQERDALEAKVQEAHLHAREAEMALAVRDQELRRAVQERQAAEVRLQETLARLAADPAMFHPFSSSTSAHPRRRGDGGGRGADAPPLAAEEGPAPASHSSSSLSRSDAEEDASAVSRSDGGESAVPCAALDSAAGGPRRYQQRLDELVARVESQRREIALLRASEEAWQGRERDLRRQLELLGRDPISETARRYGLSACENFEAQLAELAERATTLQESVDGLTLEAARRDRDEKELKEKVRAAESVVERMQSELSDARAALSVGKVELAGKVEELRENREEVARLRAELAEAGRTAQQRAEERDAQRRTRESLEQRLQELEESLTRSRAERDKFFRDNRQLIGKVEELQRDLLRADEEKRAANAALARGMATSASRGGGGGGGGGGSSARRLLRSTTAFATPAGPAHPSLRGGSASLTGDLSLTPMPSHLGGNHTPG